MKAMKSTCGWRVMIGVVLLGLLPLWGAEDDGYALLIQQSPPDGGMVNPGSGVHRTTIGEVVSLSAVPKPGYRFMYWLGDVKNSAAVDTTISVDSPKMVVAVFSRENHDEPLPPAGIIEGVATEGGGGGGRYYSPMQPAGSVSPASGPADYPDVVYNFPPDEPQPGDDDVPVPDDVPEPATLLLLGLGAFVLLKRR